jgi:segregation and condensation protein A
MIEPTLPWWRRALQFALGGIAGLFRRNGKVEAGWEGLVPAVAAAYPPEEENEETEEPKEESRVKPASPHSEPFTANEAAARDLEPAAKAVSVRFEPAAEEPAAQKVELLASAIPAESAPPAELDLPEPEPPAEFITPEVEPAGKVDVITAQQPVPEPPTPTEEPPAPTATEPDTPSVAASAPVEQVAQEISSEPRNVKGHDFSRAVGSPITVGALAPEASLPSINSEIPPDSEPTEPAAATPVQPVASTPPDQAAPAEEATEIIKIAAETAPEEESAPEAEASSEEESIPDEMETPLHESEPAQIAASASQENTAPEPAAEPAATPASQAEAPPVSETLAQESEPAPQPEPIAVAVPSAPAPAPAPPQDIAPTLPFAEKSAPRTTAEKVAAALKARGEDADQSPFSVLVNQVYDGPLDLLLDLIRKQDIDIYDIPIAKITAQFLAYVDCLRASDMDVAGDFIYTAALLIHIKSKMLLPRAPAGPDDALEDPRRELVERLLEHERFKNAAQMLLEKQMLEAATWTHPGIHEFQEDSAAEPEIAADTTDLVRVFSSILERARNRPIIDVEEDSVTVGQMIQFLARRLTMEDRPVALRRMLSHTRSERALIAMFLALLELVRLQAILLRQDRHFSEIFIKKHAGFDALMNQGLANARDDWR